LPCCGGDMWAAWGRCARGHLRWRLRRGENEPWSEGGKEREAAADAGLVLAALASACAHKTQERGCNPLSSANGVMGFVSWLDAYLNTARLLYKRTHAAVWLEP
jgi:hypothetical protein